jgi:hypothetical protein
VAHSQIIIGLKESTKMDIDLRPVRGSPSAEFSRKGGTPPESHSSCSAPYVVKGVWGSKRKRNGKGRNGELGKRFPPQGSTSDAPIVESCKASSNCPCQRLAGGESGAWVGGRVGEWVGEGSDFTNCPSLRYSSWRANPAPPESHWPRSL